MVRADAKERTFVVAVWAMTVLLVGAAVARWADVRLGDGRLGAYELFPLLGLLAFTLMWSHYVSGALRLYFDIPELAIKRYFNVTSWAVLLLILLHPGLLWYKLWDDGFGLPPGSYLSVFTGQASRIALLMGTVSLIVFLLFELRRRYHQARWWRFVEYANIVAMFAIFYHALTLGGEVSLGWFRALWFCYGVWLAIAIGYTYYHKRKEQRHE